MVLEKPLSIPDKASYQNHQEESSSGGESIQARFGSISETPKRAKEAQSPISPLIVDGKDTDERIIEDFKESEEESKSLDDTAKDLGENRDLTIDVSMSPQEDDSEG